MKKIGFIDYFLDEWHSNNYPTWINEAAAAKGIDIGVCYAYGDVDAPNGIENSEWCEKFGIEQLFSIDELIDKSDYIIVLAPDNPQHHERLSQLALKSGKPLFIDKTFAPDLDSAVRMVKLAQQYNTPLLSTSALRYAKEFLSYPNNDANRDTVKYASILGGGRFDNYIIHLIEMLVTIMGTGAKRVKSLSSEGSQLFAIEYYNNCGASLMQIPGILFQANAQLENGTIFNVSNIDDIFPTFVDYLLNFFETGISPVPTEETLETMAIREACCNALVSYDKWFDVRKI